MPSVHAFVRLAAAGLAAGLVGACAASAAQPGGSPPAPVAPGPLDLTLLGDYAGRVMTLEVDGRILVEGRLNFPPPGAEHRFEVDMGAARRVGVTLQIEDCVEAWSGEADLQPWNTSYLLIQGCDIQLLGPD